jgi:hypothetical protein
VVRAIVVGSGAVAALLAGCKAGEVIDPTPPGLVGVASLRIVAPTDSLLVADTVRLGIESRDSSGNLISGRAVAWGSSAPSIATVAPNGLVTAFAPGAVTVTATSGGKTASTDLHVVKVVFRVNVVPDAICLRKGFSTVLTLTAYDSLDRPLPPGLRPVTWRTSSGDVVAINPQRGDSSLVLGIAAGTALVSGSLMGVADTTAFIVDPAPLGQPLSCGR